MKYLENKPAIALALAASIGIIMAFGFAYHVGNKVSDEIVETIEEVSNDADPVENTDQAELEIDVVAPEGDIVEMTDEVVEDAH